jgi:hypothetical protein
MIYVDGASFTYGDELTNPVTQAWPARLASILDTKVINNANVGKSNEHMIFDTINFCISQPPKLAIVAFGPVSRKFFVRRENNFPVDIAVYSSNSMYQQHKELQQFQNLLFKYWSNHLYDCWKFLQSIICLESFFKQQGIRYMLLNTVSQQSLTDLLTISTQPSTIKDQLLDAFAEMNNDQIVMVEQQLQNLYTSIDHKNFYNFDWHFKQLVDFEGHPTAEQHQEIAKFVSTIINYDSI